MAEGRIITAKEKYEIRKELARRIRDMEENEITWSIIRNVVMITFIVVFSVAQYVLGFKINPIVMVLFCGYWAYEWFLCIREYREKADDVCRMRTDQCEIASFIESCVEEEEKRNGENCKAERNESDERNNG